MEPRGGELDRRGLLAAAAGAGMAVLLGRKQVAASDMLLRPIPATGELLPAIGMGSWITFNVGEDEERRDRRVEVLRAFFAAGGTLIDSSPMYGSSEAVIGYGLERLGDVPLFAATKVWTPIAMLGPGQMERSRSVWGIERFDLVQIHNMLAWEGHLETLLADKQAGRVRYVGMTTSHGRRHDDLAAVMAARPLDFVQFSYSVADREAERRLLPLAAERLLAVIVNRPFDGGDLFRVVEGKPLPNWAAEIDCVNWAQFFLKFVVAHPAVTCAIPATSRVDHMQQNMGALTGRLPDPDLRERMARHLLSL
jgi:aryl-alcohol dehydrogenase-like predicted oxidoreductase